MKACFKLRSAHLDLQCNFIRIQVIENTEVCTHPPLSQFMTTSGGSRRQLLQSAASVVLLASTSGRALAEEGPVVRLDLAPDQSKYNAADENLRDAAYLLQKALNAEQVQVRSPPTISTIHTPIESIAALRQARLACPPNTTYHPHLCQKFCRKRQRSLM